MREIVLDTETTGFGAEEHRIIEIGCVELMNRMPTGRVFHRYINPERAIDYGSIKVHGITDEKVKDSPVFKQIAAEFVAFMEDSPLVAHNADFDVTFINAELKRANFAPLTNPVVDTLVLARAKLPGQRHGLDSLCRTFNVDNSARVVHGALLDAQLLASVYVELLGGLQATLELAADAGSGEEDVVIEAVPGSAVVTSAGNNGLIVKATEEELARHVAFVAGIANAKWKLE